MVEAEEGQKIMYKCIPICKYTGLYYAIKNEVRIIDLFMSSLSDKS